MISDLLASITGDKPAPSSSTPSKPLSAPKRKAENELPGSAAKTPRTTPVANGPVRKDSANAASVSRLADRSVGTPSSNVKPASTSRLGGNRLGSPAVSKSTPTTALRQGPTSSSSSGLRNGATGASVQRPSPVDSGPKPEPRKKSFAEIMARAKAAQQSLPQTLGKIQHKTIDTGMTKRERDTIKLSEARKAAKLAKQGGAVKPSGSGTSSRSPATGSATSKKETSGKTRKAAPVEEVKKVKKAALATTGYAGTARPRPGATSGKPNGASSRAGSEAARPREQSRYGGALSGPRRRRDEEEDEDLDDFIEYDDEEEEPGYGLGGRGRGRGGYDSLDDESDMEAGLTDVEEEERRAERVARLEDKKEQELEMKLKREKEERRRREMMGKR